MGHLCYICRHPPAHSYLHDMLLCKMLLQREKEEEEEAGTENQYERDLGIYNRSTGNAGSFFFIIILVSNMFKWRLGKVSLEKRCQHVTNSTCLKSKIT